MIYFHAAPLKVLAFILEMYNSVCVKDKDSLSVYVHACMCVIAYCCVQVCDVMLAEC